VSWLPWDSTPPRSPAVFPHSPDERLDQLRNSTSSPSRTLQLIYCDEYNVIILRRAAVAALVESSRAADDKIYFT